MGFNSGFKGLTECPVKLPENQYFLNFIFAKPALNALSSVRQVTWLLNHMDVFTVKVTLCMEDGVMSLGLTFWHRSFTFKF